MACCSLVCCRIDVASITYQTQHNKYSKSFILFCCFAETYSTHLSYTFTTLCLYTHAFRSVVYKLIVMIFIVIIIILLYYAHLSIYLSVLSAQKIVSHYHHQCHSHKRNFTTSFSQMNGWVVSEWMNEKACTRGNSMGSIVKLCSHSLLFKSSFSFPPFLSE